MSSSVLCALPHRQSLYYLFYIQQQGDNRRDANQHSLMRTINDITMVHAMAMSQCNWILFTK